jgi:DNA-binding beta-propeller fold protein YncE
VRLRLLLALLGLIAPVAALAETAPLALEAKIPLGSINGRIDHLAIDLKRQRLFVAELGNDTLGVVDLAAGRVLRTISGFHEPQGVGYAAFADSIYVANAGDGAVQVLRGEDFALLARIALGDDADNIRIDAQRRRVLVGYGSGALAIIDPATQSKTAQVKLKAHPEGFQIDGTGTQVAVNVPDARDIQVVDLATLAVRSFQVGGLRGNFPMAVDRDARRFYLVFRNPATLVALASAEGRPGPQAETCGDADDVFVDAKRHRIYVSCGEGVIDVFEEREGQLRRLAKAPTVSGARTSLFVPELDRLFVAVRANWSEPAAIWVFRPVP